MNERFRACGSGVALLLAAVLITGCAENPESLLASAKANLAKNDRNAAVIQLRNALQKNPDMPEARFLLGKSLLESGDFLGAEKELRRAKELNFGSDEVVPVLARVLVRRGEHKKAIEEFGGVAIGAPAQRADLQTTIGQAHMALGNTDAARTAFASALSAQPDYPLALLGEARLKAAGGDLPGALAVVEATIAKSPALTEAWQLKGDLLVAQGQVEPALAAFRKAVETRPDQLAAHYMIVTLLMQQNKTEESTKAFAAMKKVAPTSPLTLYLQALLAYRDKDYAAAREAIQQHLKSSPDSLMGMLLGAQIDFQFGSYAKVEAALATVLQRAPRQAYARRLLIQAYLRDGRPGKALETLQPLLQDPQQDPDTLALAGEVYAQNGDTAAAARYFEQAATRDPKSTTKRTSAALAHLARGETERGLGELEAAATQDTGIRADLALALLNTRQRKFDAALAAVDAIERKQPDKPLPHSLRGGVLFAKGDLAGARRSFERAIAIDPTYFPAIVSLSRLDLAEKKPEEAKKRFDALLAKEPNNAQALLALADLRARAGASSDEVAALLGKAIKSNPADPSARLMLIGHYTRSKEPKNAVAAAQEAVAAFPDRPDVLDAAGQAYRAAGDLNQAIKTYNKLVQIRPDSTLPLMRLADIQIAAKDNLAALEYLRKALALKPDLLEAQRGIVTLSVANGRTDEALKTAREVQRARPKESVGYILEGNVFASNKAWNEAASAYRVGLKQASSTELAIRLYSALKAGGKASDADAFAASWLREHPKDRGFRHNLAQKALASKEYAAAATQYKALLEIEPSDVLALNNLAWVAGQLKDPKALEYAERASKLAPANHVVLDTYGVLLVENGDTARGLEMLQKAMTIAPDAAENRLHLARALIKAGQKDAARKELETLAKLGDKFSGQADVAKLMQGL
jgi:putative PEP-CTERM system TPR-repeat lipoprotein